MWPNLWTQIERQAERVKSRLALDLFYPAYRGGEQFTCNLCGQAQHSLRGRLTQRETASCWKCKSTLRFRAIVFHLGQALGFSGPLAEWTPNPGIRGLGMSDDPRYAEGLQRVFAYENTFFDTEPRFDIRKPDPARLGKCDFVISSDVFEHVSGHLETAFANLARLLKPGGVLIFSVPYRMAGVTQEHYPELHDWRVEKIGGRWKLFNRTAEGDAQEFADPVFHGGPGQTVELRVFALPDIERHLRAAGFSDIRVCDPDVLESGMLWDRADPQPSYPIVARMRGAE